MTANTTTKSVDILNSFLRGEISAVETYGQVIEKLKDAPIPKLAENQACHSKRVAALRSRVLALGGTPAESSGVWGSLAKLYEGGAKVFGRDAAVAAIEEGEDRGLADYRKSYPDLDAISQDMLRNDLLPAQLRTHAVARDIKHMGVEQAQKNSARF
jgi:hypothetical protein